MKHAAFRRIAGTTVIAASFAVLSACSMMSSAPPAPAKVADGVFTDSKDMTLYTFDKDATPGKSVCNDKCASNWPPLMVADGATASGDWSVVTRDDGKKQWAYKGKPLYTWIKDTKPGDKTGEGAAGNTWHVAKP
jgi:predicted lipoprotein with Yx(FWY)xxD motif